MKKQGLLLISLLFLLLAGCTLFKKPLDRRTGFSSELISLDSFIVSGKLGDAEKPDLCLGKVGKGKAMMQLELDHDVSMKLKSG